MSRSLAAAVGAALLVATCVVAVPTPVVAEDDHPSRVALRDGAGDVWKSSNSDDPVRAKRPTVDITRGAARHGEHAVTARVRFVNLRRVEGIHLYFIRIRTRAGVFLVGVEASPDNWPGGSVLFDETDNQAPCHRLTHRIDYADDMMTVRVPRRCLGTPAWVQLSLLNALQKPWSADEGEVWFADSAHSRRARWGRTQRLSPS